MQLRPILRRAIVTIAALAAVPAFAYSGYGDYYVNRDGKLIHRPEHEKSRPAGAEALCRDGEYSFSTHHRGTCSGHGGVAQWYR